MPPSYTYNAADRLTAVNSTAVSSDANGEVLADETGGAYTWDVRGRLSSLTRNGASASFLYDQNDLRISKTVGGTQTTYLLDGDEVVRETTAGTPTDLLQGPGTDNLLSRGGNWLLHNGLDSTSAVVNGSGSILQYYYYAPFGQATVQGGGSVQPYQFTGREADESGLMYYRARYYNPGWGRFVSQDPIGFGGGINPYVYCGNNPVSNADPSGAVDNSGEGDEEFLFGNRMSVSQRMARAATGEPLSQGRAPGMGRTVVKNPHLGGTGEPISGGQPVPAWHPLPPGPTTFIPDPLNPGRIIPPFSGSPPPGIFIPSRYLRMAYEDSLRGGPPTFGPNDRDIYGPGGIVDDQEVTSDLPVYNGGPLTPDPSLPPPGYNGPPGSGAY